MELTYIKSLKINNTVVCWDCYFIYDDGEERILRVFINGNEVYEMWRGSARRL